MKNLITISDLNFSYNNKKIFTDLNLKIKKGSFITILGSSGSGKTTLYRILNGKLNYEGNIIIDELNLIEALNDRENFFDFDDSINKFSQDKVIDEFRLCLRKSNYSDNEINDKINELVSTFDINYLLDFCPLYLSSSEKQIISLVKLFLIQPKIIIMDDFLSMLDNEQRLIVFKYLRKINKTKKTTIINITGNIEDSIYGSDIALINDSSIIVSDKKEIVLSQEKLFRKANLDLPFMADLSIKLGYYELLDKIILDKNKMVNELWK